MKIYFEQTKRTLMKGVSVIKEDNRQVTLAKIFPTPPPDMCIPEALTNASHPGFHPLGKHV